MEICSEYALQAAVLSRAMRWTSPRTELVQDISHGHRATDGAAIDRETVRRRQHRREPWARGQREIDTADANLPQARDGLELGKDLLQSFPTERAIEEEDRSADYRSTEHR